MASTHFAEPNQLATQGQRCDSMASADSPGPADTPENCFSARFFYILAGILAVCGLLAFFLDHAVSGQLAAPPHRFPFLGGDLEKLVALSEIFGHGMGVAMVVLAVFALDRVNRWRVGIVIGTASVAGLMATLMKFLLVARYRPMRFDFSQPISASFHQWFPFWHWFSMDELRETALQSFPSGHSATAAGLCVGLCFLYPHARWYFLLVAGLACFQRIAFWMHFPSDVCFGAALGMATATLLLTKARLPEAVHWCELKARQFGANRKPE